MGDDSGEWELCQGGVADASALSVATSDSINITLLPLPSAAEWTPSLDRADVSCPPATQVRHLRKFLARKLHLLSALDLEAEVLSLNQRMAEGAASEFSSRGIPLREDASVSDVLRFIWTEEKPCFCNIPPASAR
ncbi:hypothetical protein T484DRAFT_1837962 [Baffinella frigidus]|nr:hypothetical protein T484DRAFT_1837962 [Cryptophyta sp. CCMP2293]